MLETQRAGLDDVRAELERTASAAERLIAALERLGILEEPIVLSREGEEALQAARLRAAGRGRLTAVNRNAN
jgi:exonuclease VII small subunit